MGGLSLLGLSSYHKTDILIGIIRLTLKDLLTNFEKLHSRFRRQGSTPKKLYY